VANGDRLAAVRGDRRFTPPGFFFLTRIASFWIFAWAREKLIYIDWSPLFLGLAIAVTYI
jgi:hypothetical protein